MSLKTYRLLGICALAVVFPTMMFMTLLHMPLSVAQELSLEEQKAIQGGDVCAVKLYRQVCFSICNYIGNSTWETRLTDSNYRECTAQNNSGKNCSWDFTGIQIQCKYWQYYDSACNDFKASGQTFVAKVIEQTDPNCQNILP